MFVRTDTYNQRMSTCKACEHYVTTTGTCGTIGVGSVVDNDGERTRTCGCVMKLKCKFRLSACPLGKWTRTVSDKDVAEMVYTYNKYKDAERLTGAQIREIVGVFEKATGKSGESTQCAPCIKKYIEEIGLALKQL